MLMSALLVTACGDNNSPTAVNPESLELSFNGLQSLGSGFVYEGWVMVNGNPVSTGKFSVGADGNLSRQRFVVVDGLSSTTKFILTIEPVPDFDPAPSATKYLAGDFSGNRAALSVADGVALGTNFASASGSFILETPSTAAVARDYASGIWWLDPGGPSASLVLPALPAGWLYEGWVVGPEGPVSTGRFAQVMGADSDAGGPAAGPDGMPPFPGQEFITPLVSLIGYQAVVSIEPEPSDSPGPFTLKPLVDTNIEDVGPAVLQAHGQQREHVPDRDRDPLTRVSRRSASQGLRSTSRWPLEKERLPRRSDGQVERERQRSEWSIIGGSMGKHSPSPEC